MSTGNNSRVSEIFSFAGMAFTKLGELTMHLQAYQENNSASGKWDDDDIEMLRNAVKRFGEDLHKVSESIKSKTSNQLKANLKKKAFEQSNLILEQVVASSSTNIETSLATSTSKITEKPFIFDETPVVESELEV